MIALLLALAPVAVCHDIDGGSISCKSHWAIDPHWRQPANCENDCTPRCAPRTVYGEVSECTEPKFRSFVGTPAQTACLDREFALRQHDHTHIGVGPNDPFARCGMTPKR